MEMVQLTSVLRSSEKTIEQQIETAESLEKTRDYQMRILAENAETVIVLHCDTFFWICQHSTAFYGLHNSTFSMPEQRKY